MADVGILYHAGAAWSGHIMFMQKPAQVLPSLHNKGR